jgi:hypothetical protein
LAYDLLTSHEHTDTAANATMMKMLVAGRTHHMKTSARSMEM